MLFAAWLRLTDTAHSKLLRRRALAAKQRLENAILGVDDAMSKVRQIEGEEGVAALKKVLAMACHLREHLIALGCGPKPPAHLRPFLPELIAAVDELATDIEDFLTGIHAPARSH